MKKALRKGEELPPHKMAFSSKTLVRLTMFLPQFEQKLKQNKISLAVQNKKTRDYDEVVRKARMYLTHFIRVMNMAVFRGELPPETRTWYGFTASQSTVPSLNTENDLLTWGKRVIEGEEMRIRKGGSPITNPTVAVVKVRFTKFVDYVTFYANKNKKADDYTRQISEMRKEADAIILDIWNEVEKTHSSLPDELRKDYNEEYGLVYFYRKEELKKPDPKIIAERYTETVDLPLAFINPSMNLSNSFAAEIKK
jgi:hypothetical protein